MLRSPVQHEQSSSMAKIMATAGYFQNGQLYACIDSVPTSLVIFGGGPEFDPQAALRPTAANVV